MAKFKGERGYKQEYRVDKNGKRTGKWVKSLTGVNPISKSDLEAPVAIGMKSQNGQNVAIVPDLSYRDGQGNFYGKGARGGEVMFRKIGGPATEHIPEGVELFKADRISKNMGFSPILGEGEFVGFLDDEFVGQFKVSRDLFSGEVIVESFILE